MNISVQTKTQEEYDKLMVDLEEKGYSWKNLSKPTKENYFLSYKEKTHINIHIYNADLTFGHENKFPKTISTQEYFGEEEDLPYYKTL